MPSTAKARRSFSCTVLGEYRLLGRSGPGRGGTSYGHSHGQPRPWPQYPRWTSGVKDGVEKNPTFAAYIERAGREYAAHSATPKDYDSFVDQISKMWAEQPNWSDAQLKAIDTPILVVDGDHDEAIKREHTEYIAAMIPHTGLLILPNTSHFAFLQDPRQFNFAILHFLGDE
jgi:pimeloyl-ACP methyl ester carboxylesterase